MTEMNAIEISAPGDADVLTLCKRPVPEPAAGEVLIKVTAAGINRPDVLQRMGLYPPPEGASDLPGLEVSGVVVKTGDGVEAGLMGQKVCALMPGGGYAEYAVADARLCLPVPDTLSMTEAAGLPETFFTVWTNVFEDGGLAAGETLLVHGGASGIGTTAIAMATTFGAKVITTAGTDEKCAMLEKMGAAHAFNYKTADWAAEIQKLGGVDVVLDMIGGDYVQRNLNCLKPRGRHVSIAFLGGMTAEINIMQVMRGRLTLTGSTLRARTPDEKALIASALRDRVWPLIEEGNIKPVIDQVMPLADASAAHKRMEASSHIGKIILEVTSA
jgi:putative PIG3 family NAD(P)H quinone oxidoreductase